MQQIKINMTITFIETCLNFGHWLDFGQVTVRAGSNGDNDSNLEFSFDIPENPSSKLKKRN
jgi:hypothetical protein